MKKAITAHNLKEIGERLYRIRKILGINQTMFAEMLGLNNYKALLTYEKGQVEPPLAIVSAAARFGNTTTDWILIGKGPEPPPKEKTFIKEDSIEYEIARMVKALPKSKQGTARAVIRAMVEEEKKKMRPAPKDDDVEAAG